MMELKLTFEWWLKIGLFEVMPPSSLFSLRGISTHRPSSPYIAFVSP